MSTQKAYTVVIDDNLLMKDTVSTAGSKILANFIPPYEAAVISKIKEAGMKIAGQSIPCEFGISVTDSFGSLEWVAAGKANVGLGCDVHGAIRNRAVEGGISFIKPTYGMVSRFGLVSTAPSMEQIGVACQNIEEGFDVLSVVAGFDQRDGALAEAAHYAFSPEFSDVKGLRVAVFEDFKDEMAPVSQLLMQHGAQVDFVPFPLLPTISGTAYIILSAETGGSISRYDGIKFGFQSQQNASLEEVYLNTRSESFTFETKILTLMGMHVLTKEQFSEVFEQALKVRRLILEKTKELFTSYDIIALPAGSRHADDTDAFSAFCTAYGELSYSALPNLTGFPSVALPFKSSSLPGVQFMAKSFSENQLFAMSKWFQNAEKEASR